jgi:hypothetical protein
VTRARFFFSPRSGTLLWATGSANPFTDPEGLPVSRELRDEPALLLAWYDTSLNWDYPPDPGPWREAECRRFNAAAQRALDRLRTELGAAWEITDEFTELHEDPDLDRYLTDPAGFVR